MTFNREPTHQDDVALTGEEDLLGIADVNRQERERYETMDPTALAEEIDRLRDAVGEKERATYLALREIYERRRKPMA